MDSSELLRPPKGIDVIVDFNEIRVHLPELARQRAVERHPRHRRSAARLFSPHYTEAMGDFILIIVLVVALTVLVQISLNNRWPNLSQDMHVLIFVLQSVLSLALLPVLLSNLRKNRYTHSTANAWEATDHLRVTQHSAFFNDELETLEMPLEAITGARATSGRVRIEANGGVLHLFDALNPTQAAWIAALLQQRSEQKRTA